MCKKVFLASVFLILSVLLPLCAQGTDEVSAASRYDSYAGKTSMGPSIVASTSWVGAIAEAAGATKVQVLAPMELRHPPEYDFAPQDIINASKADLVMWAGYEGFVKQLVRAAGIDESRLIKVNTNNAPDQLETTVRQVAELLGTIDRYEAWKADLDEWSATMQAQVARNSTTRVAVQFHHQGLARYLGYDVVQVFGPQELSLGDVRAVEELEIDLIIDNWHSVQGESLKAPDRDYIQLINFPGPFGTKSILDVLTFNAERLGLLPPATT